jgi:hypothetical protein
VIGLHDSVVAFQLFSLSALQPFPPGSRLETAHGYSAAAYSFEMTKNAQFLVYIQKPRPLFRRLPFNTLNRTP